MPLSLPGKNLIAPLDVILYRPKKALPKYAEEFWHYVNNVMLIPNNGQ